MNVVTATSPAIAPGAGVIPGSASGATPGVGPSFADVLQQLAGDHEAASVVGGGSSRATGVGAAAGGTSDADDSGSDLAGASADHSTDHAMAMGAMIVPVAVVVPPVSELSPADVAGDVPYAADDPTPVTGASGLPAPARSAASTTVVGAGAADVALRTAGRTHGQAAAGASGPQAGRVHLEPEETPGTAVQRLVGTAMATDSAAGHVGHGAGETVPTPGGAASGGVSAGAARPAWHGTARTSADRSSVASASPSASTVSTTVGPTFDGATTVDAEETPAAATSQAAAVVARLMADPTRDRGRALGLPRALTRVLEGGPSAGFAPDAPTEFAAGVSAAAAAMPPTDVEGLVADMSAPAAPAVAAATRRAHPGLSAALRAFQQAGAPIATGGPTDAQAQAVTESVGHLVAAARSATVTGGEAESSPPGAQAGGRPFAAPAMSAAIAPSSGGDLRVGSTLGWSARLDGASVATLAPAEGEDVRAQLVQSIRVQWTGGAGEARVRLRPEHLGEVVATIKVEQGAVTATLQAERPDVRRWLEAHTQTLREGLMEHGLKLDRLIVLTEPVRGETRDDTQGRARGRHPQQPQQRPRRPRPDDSGATFDLNT